MLACEAQEAMIPGHFKQPLHEFEENCNQRNAKMMNKTSDQPRTEPQQRAERKRRSSIIRFIAPIDSETNGVSSSAEKNFNGVLFDL